MTRWPRQQWLLRGAMVVLAAAAPLASAPDLPPSWLLVLVVALAAGWAWRPESSAGAVALVLVLAWWGIGVDDPLRPGLLGAALALLGAHLAATLASYGPARMRVERALVLLWGRRAALCCVPPVVAWSVLRVLDDAPDQPGLWTVALLTVAALVGLASVAVRGDPEG